MRATGKSHVAVSVTPLPVGVYYQRSYWSRKHCIQTSIINQDLSPHPRDEGANVAHKGRDSLQQKNDRLDLWRKDADRYMIKKPGEDLGDGLGSFRELHRLLRKYGDNRRRKISGGRIRTADTRIT